VRGLVTPGPFAHRWRVGSAWSLRAIALSALAVSGLLGASSARADDAGIEDCGPPTELGPLEFFPASSASGVALNSAVRVRYTPGFFEIWRDPLTRLLEVRDDADAPVAGTLERLGDTLVFRPDVPWRPNSQYEGTAFGIDILQTSFRFRTGNRDDVQPPVFDGTPTISPAVVDARPCVDDGGYRIDVTIAPATDSDGAGGDIEYLLFQTRGPRLERPLLRSRARNFAGISIPLAFTLTPSEAVSPVCITILAVDGVGHTVSGPTRCVDPIQGNFFAPLCSVSAPGAPRGVASSTSVVLLGAALAALLARRRR